MYGIEEARQALLASVDGMTEAQLNEELEPGRWTIAQVLEHLYLMERGITARTKQLLDDGNSKPAHKPKPIENTLNRTYKVDAPALFQPEQRPFSRDETFGKLSESRNTLLRVIHGVEDHSIFSEKSAKHPVFGTMDLTQWIEFIGLHERRHLEQINELKGKLGEVDH